MLQWGHDREVVEISSRAREIHEATSVLQWGHDREVVEIHFSAI
jgi:hypothetical protein